MVYEVDGYKVVNLLDLYKRFEISEIKLIKKEYPNKKAAKMWYDILVNGEKEFIIEIRWKGTIFVSPQIIIQKV